MDDGKWTPALPCADEKGVISRIERYAGGKETPFDSFYHFEPGEREDEYWQERLDESNQRHETLRSLALKLYDPAPPKGDPLIYRNFEGQQVIVDSDDAVFLRIGLTQKEVTKLAIELSKVASGNLEGRLEK